MIPSHFCECYMEICCVTPAWWMRLRIYAMVELAKKSIIIVGMKNIIHFCVHIQTEKIKEFGHMACETTNYSCSVANIKLPMQITLPNTLTIWHDINDELTNFILKTNNLNMSNILYIICSLVRIPCSLGISSYTQPWSSVSSLGRLIAPSN